MAVEFWCIGVTSEKYSLIVFVFETVTSLVMVEMSFGVIRVLKEFEQLVNFAQRMAVLSKEQKMERFKQLVFFQKLFLAFFFKWVHASCGFARDLWLSDGIYHGLENVTVFFGVFRNFCIIFLLQTPLF